MFQVYAALEHSQISYPMKYQKQELTNSLNVFH